MAEAGEALVALMAEAYRLRLLRGLEDLMAADGLRLVAGVDEAGRGCLAGPVVAAAVVVEPGFWLPGVDDSKKLKRAQRERLATEIERRAVAVHWVAIEADVIDRVNILEATRMAMRESIEGLATRPDAVLLDAVALKGLPYPSMPVIRGDSFSFAIAAASIVAKTQRDRLMDDLEDRYPGYGFADNKGYGARRHREALELLGPTPVHRLTFRSVLPRTAPAERGAA
ncbi:MAG: ribonuclease HII [Acidobacteriota bacterium]